MLAVAGFGLALLVRRQPEAAFGPLFLLVTLSPSLAVIMVGHTADRFAYLPTLGLAHLLGVGLAAIRSRPGRQTAALAVAAAALLLGLLSRGECRAWHDAGAVWGRAVSLYPDIPEFRTNLGNALMAAGDLTGAIAQYDLALAIMSTMPGTRNNLENTLPGSRNSEGAIAEYGPPLVLDRTFREARVNRAAARDRSGDSEGALRDLEEVLTMYPADAAAWVTRGVVLGRRGDHRGAEESFSRALAVRPGFYDALVNRGIARLGLGDLEGAREDWRAAVRSDPTRDDAREFLAGPGAK